MIKAVVFDFDGVIVRLSELIKQGAWGFIAHHPDIGDRAAVAEAEQYYSRNRGNRYDILRRVFEKLGKWSATIPALINKHAERFNSVVQEGIQSLGIPVADKKILKELRGQYCLYINSGTPEKAMRETAQELGIAVWFSGIYGQEQGKIGNLSRAMTDSGAYPREMVFVGDSEWDYEAAEKFGCHFIGMVNHWNDWRDKQFPLVSSLSEIAGVIKTLEKIAEAGHI